MKRSPRSKRRSRRHFETLESRQLLAAISGEVFFDLDQNGVRGPSEQPAAQVRVYVDDNANGRLDAGEIATRTDADGVYTFPQVAAGNYQIRIVPNVGDVQIGPSTTYGYNSVAIAQPDGSLVRGSQLFSLDQAGVSTNIGQPIPQRIDGLTRIDSGVLIGADTRDNRLFRINPTNGEATLIGATNLDIVDGLVYDPVADSVLTLVRDGFSPAGRRLASVDTNTARVTLIGGGFSGLNAVSNLSFDVANGRLIGFDDFDDEFFAFDRFGNGSSLSRTSRPLDVDVLTLPGRNWPGAGTIVAGGPTQALIFDADDRQNRNTVLVNVDSGLVTPSVTLNQPLAATSLHSSFSGDAPRTVSVTEFQTLGGVNFGVARDFTGFRVKASNPATAFGSLGSIGLTVVGGAIGNDIVEISLNHAPTGNVRLLLTSSGEQGGTGGVVLSDTELIFTPTDWATPRRVTVSPDQVNPVVQITNSLLTVAVDPVNSDIAFRSLPQKSVPIRVLPPTGQVNPLGPVINELLVTAANPLTGQFIELRGVPNSTLPAGTYFVVVSEDFIETGEIITVIDLSGQQFGANGFLVLLQQNSPHATAFGSRVVTSNAAGFSGLPGNIYSSRTGNGELYDDFFDISAGAYMLVQSNTPIVVGQDIDTNNDGLLDRAGVGGGWTRFDSLSIHPFLSSPRAAYSPIVGVEDRVNLTRTTPAEPGTQFVFLDTSGYAARVGDSIGSTREDWAFGEVSAVTSTTTRPDADPVGILEVGPEVPSHPVLFDRPLDHIGTSNFQGGVRGRITLTPSAADLAAGVPAGTTTPGQGIRVIADTNGNGRLDDLTFVLDPDSVSPPFDPLNPLAQEGYFTLTTEYPGVTISATSRNGDRMADDVLAEREFRGTQTLGDRVFSNGEVRGFLTVRSFSEFEPLRFDFFRPIKQASIDFGQSLNSFTNQTATLEAFNAAGQVIARSVSNSITSGQRTTLSVSFPGEEIVRLQAYSDFSFYGGFDRLVYTQSEPSAVTDQDGVYEIAGLKPGAYSIRAESSLATGSLLGQVTRNVNVTRYQNFFFDDLLQPNSSPQANDDTLTVDENLPSGAFVGLVPANDADRAPLLYELIGGVSRGYVINPSTGEISVASGAVLDFETDPQAILTVRVTDTSGDTTTARVTINLRDINEAPVVADTDLLITEAIPNNTVIGAIPATDPDVQRNQTLIYEVLGGTGATAFRVDPSTGVVTLLNGSALDFETFSTLTLRVRVTDNDPIPASVIVDQIIRIEDENDAPTLAQNRFTIPENSSGELFRLNVTDPDVLQTHQFDLVTSTGSTPFRILQNGAVILREGAVLDFEQSAVRTFQVRISDNGNPPIAVTDTITLNLTNVPEPTRLLESQIAFTENQPNLAVVLTLQDDDSDIADSAMALLPGADTAPFQFDSLTNTIRLRPGVVLDRETQSSYRLNFEIIDRLGLIQETIFQTLVVNVLDDNEAPSIVTNELRVSEIPRPGDVIGRVQTSDPENNRLTLSIIGGSAQSRFEIDPDSHLIRVRPGATFDAETPNDLRLLLRANDTGGNTVDRELRIIINDVNEAPTFNQSAVASIPNLIATSGAPFEVVLPPDLASDPENRAFTIRVFGANGTLPSWLEFDETTRRLFSTLTPLVSGTPSLDGLDPNVYVTGNTFPLTIRAIETGPFPLSTDLNLTLTISGSGASLQNQRDRFDVDNNRIVTALDALRVINFLVQNDGSTSIDATRLSQYGGFLDVDNNGRVEPLDALLVINEITRRRTLENSEPTMSVVSSDEDRLAAVDEVLRNDFDSPSLF